MQQYLSSTALSGAASGALANVATVLPSNDTIQLDDFVALGSDGNIYAVADPTVAGVSAIAKPAYLAAPTVATILSPLQTLATGVASNLIYRSLGGAPLSNGNLAVLYAQSTSLIAAIFSPTGALQAAFTVVSGVTNPQGAVCGLTGGGFAVVFSNGTHTSTAIYANSGAVVQAATVFDSTSTINGSGAQGAVYNIAALSNGAFAVSYVGQVSTLYYLYYGVIGATGTVVLSATSFATVGGAVYTPLYWSDLKPLTGGGFVVVNGLSATQTFGIYNNAGVLQGSVVTVNSQSGFVWAAPLVGGGFAIAFSKNLQDVWVNVYNSSGSLQGSSLEIDTTTYYPGTTGDPGVAASASVALVGLTGGGCAVIWANMASITALSTANINVAQISAAGALVGVLALTTGSTSNCDVAIAATSDGGALAHYSIGTTDYTVKLTAAGAVAATPFSAGGAVAGGGADSVKLIALGAAVAKLIQSSNLSLTVYYAVAVTPARVPIGVAQLAGGVGASITVQISGYSTTRLTFSSAWSCNYQSNSPPGQKMSLVGNEATLYGVL